MSFFDDVMNSLENKCYDYEKNLRKKISKFSDEQILKGMRNQNNAPAVRALFQDEAIRRGIY